MRNCLYFFKRDYRSCDCMNCMSKRFHEADEMEAQNNANSHIGRTLKIGDTFKTHEAGQSRVVRITAIRQIGSEVFIKTNSVEETDFQDLKYFLRNHIAIKVQDLQSITI